MYFVVVSIFLSRMQGSAIYEKLHFLPLFYKNIFNSNMVNVSAIRPINLSNIKIGFTAITNQFR